MAIEKVELKDALNALVTNTNIDKVTGVLGGVPSNIAKADLASVMAGLMTSSKLFPFMGKGTARYGDLNNITDSGFYHVGAENNYQNTPGFGWFCLAVYKSYIITQVAFGLSSSGTWYRTMEDSGSYSWSPWKRIDNFGYNTLADLSSAVAKQIRPFLPKDEATGDIDNIVDSGAFLCYADSVTSSVSLPFDSVFILMTFATGYSEYFKFQMAVDVENNNKLEVKMRRLRSTWTEWKSVSFV